MTKRITPLLEDEAASSDVRELLQAGRDSHVSDYDYGAGLERHLGLVQAGAPLPDWAKGLEGGSGTGAGAVAGTGLIGWLALPVVTVAVVGAVWLLRSDESEVTPPPPAGAGLTVPSHVATPAGAPAAGPSEATLRADRAGAAAGEGAAPRAEASRRAAVRGRAPAAAKASAAKRAPLAGTRPGSSPNANANGDAADFRSDDLFAGSPVATATRGSNVARPAANAAQAEREPAETADERTSEQQAATKPEPAVIDDTRLEREMGMLAVAQRVLHTDPARALALSRQGEAEFAGSMFTQERKQLELLALVKLGRLDEAKRLARPYLARYPNGPFSDRVRRALATGRVER
jgi:hypothetical protein